MESIAKKGGSVQGLVRAAVDSLAAKTIDAIVQQAIRDIAVVLFSRKAKQTDMVGPPARADISDVYRLGGEALVKSYEADAAMVLRQRDPQLHREAVYYAANAATPGGIGSLTISERAAVIEQIEVAQRAYRDALSNRAEPTVLARLGRLREADDAVADGERLVGVISQGSTEVH